MKRYMARDTIDCMFCSEETCFGCDVPRREAGYLGDEEAEAEEGEEVEEEEEAEQ